tara:strand:- start:72 stop:764 length:693 start_codon:yes stop_codon:yes gene_type:complete
MIPLYDENTTKTRSYIRFLILIICSLVFFVQISTNTDAYIINYFGFKPKSLHSNETLNTFYPFLSLITSLFIHGGWIHFLGNMLYLWIFADNVEDEFGHQEFFIFYLSAGVFANLSQFIFNVDSNVPVVGASGAIAGVLGAYLYLFPKAKILVLLPFLIFFTIRVPAFALLIFWFFYQFLNLSNQESNVAWLAHIGGFLFGLIYCIIFNKKKRKFVKGKSILLRRKGPWD